MRAYLKRFACFLLLAVVMTGALVFSDVIMNETVTLLGTIELASLSSWITYFVIAALLCGVFALFKL